MRVYFVRHGNAEERKLDDAGDERRALTKNGLLEMERVAKSVERLGVKIDVIISSPLLRARQTAEILHERLGSARKLVIDDRLSPSFDSAKLFGILDAQTNSAAIMLVGHEPSFSSVVGEVTGGSRIELKKGGVALVEFDGNDRSAGTLLWLAPPRILASHE